MVSISFWPPLPMKRSMDVITAKIHAWALARRPAWRRRMLPEHPLMRQRRIVRLRHLHGTSGEDDH